MRKLACLAGVLTLVLGAGAASAQTSSGRGAVTTAKTCSAGYVLAHLSWGEKCLHAGEFCKVGNAQYHRYAYTCPASGHLTYYEGPMIRVSSTTSVTERSRRTGRRPASPRTGW